MYSKIHVRIYRFKCLIYDLKTSLIKNPLLWVYKTGIYDKVEDIDPKIIGGSAADLGDFPYQCLLESETQQVIRSCGCSIIAQNWVVTATFCTNNMLDYYKS